MLRHNKREPREPRKFMMTLNEHIYKELENCNLIGLGRNHKHSPRWPSERCSWVINGLSLAWTDGFTLSVLVHCSAELRSVQCQVVAGYLVLQLFALLLYLFPGKRSRSVEWRSLTLYS